MTPVTTIGIIGAGEIVSKAHLPVLLSMDGVAVSWVTDADTRKSAALAGAYGIRHEDLPSDPGRLPHADVVLLAIPYGARAPYYAALRDRRTTALYVEKPFSRTQDEHQRLCSWFPDHRLGCGFQKRSWGPVLLLEQVVRQQLFGRLESIRFEHGAAGVVVGGKYHGDAQLAGGGLLFETGVHGIDAIVFATHAVDVRVRSARMIVEGGFDLDTTATLDLTPRDGGNVRCELAVSSLRDTPDALRFVFECATVSCSFSSERLLVETRAGQRLTLAADDASGYPTTVYQTFHRHWLAFLDGVRSGRTSLASASEALLTTAIVERLYEAAA